MSNRLQLLLLVPVAALVIVGPFVLLGTLLRMM